MKKIIFFTTLFLFFTTQAFSETRYVTDRILLGIHTEADAGSTLIKSVPSGTELEVINSVAGFLEIQLEDDTKGWVSSGFVMEEIPSTRKYDVLAHQYEQTTQELDKLKIEHAKQNRELQIRRDQISNANTTIRDLKKRKSTGATVVDPETENKLMAALKKIEELNSTIRKLKEKPKTVINVDQQKIVSELNEVKDQNDIMQQRIDVALAHLNGDRIATAEELESIRPQFPTWYWTLLSIILLVGIIIGYFIMDYRLRRRHGGFRV